MNERLFVISYITDTKPKTSYEDMIEELEPFLDLAAQYINKGRGHFEIIDPIDLDQYDWSAYENLPA